MTPVDERDPRLGEQMVAASQLLSKNGFGHWSPPYPVSGHVGYPLTDADVARIPRPCLETLDVTATRITDRGVAVLAGSPSLRFLTIRQTRTTAAGMLPLRACTSLERITTSLGWRDRRSIRRALPNVEVD